MTPAAIPDAPVNVALSLAGLALGLLLLVWPYLTRGRK